MSLFIEKSKLKLLQGKAKMVNGAWKEASACEDVTEKVLSIVYKYLEEVAKAREANGLSSTFQISNINSNFVLQVIDTKRNTAETNVLLEKNDFLIKSFDPFATELRELSPDKVSSVIKEKNKEDNFKKVNKEDSTKNNSKKKIISNDKIVVNSSKKGDNETGNSFNTSSQVCLDLEEISNDQNQTQEISIIDKPKRKRRTKAEMEAARNLEEQ